MKRLSRLWVYDLPGIVVGILGLEREKNDMGLMVNVNVNVLYTSHKGMGIRSTADCFSKKKEPP